jgi:hypothetical protein
MAEEKKNVNTAKGFKGEYGPHPPILSPIVEGPHGFEWLPPMDEVPADPLGLNPCQPTTRTKHKGGVHE